jgi:hypothetical protein
MRGLTISSLAFILALYSTVAVAAPKPGVSPLPYPRAAGRKKRVVEEVVLKAESPSCKIRGACSSLSPPDTCCGACILIDSAIVSTRYSSPLSIFRLTSYLCRVTACLPGLPYVSSTVRYVIPVGYSHQ